MRFTRKERLVLESAWTNYKRLWDDSSKLPEEIPYVNANIIEFRAILQKIKDENIQ